MDGPGGSRRAGTEGGSSVTSSLDETLRKGRDEARTKGGFSPRKARAPDASPAPEAQPPRKGGGDSSDPEENGLKPNIDYRRISTVGEGGGYQVYIGLSGDGKKFFESRASADPTSDASYRPIRWPDGYGKRVDAYVPSDQYAEYAAAGARQLAELTKKR